MRYLPPIFVAATLAGLAGWPAIAPAAEGKADPDALRTAQRQLRSPVVAERVDGVKRLRELPELDAIRLLVPARLNDPQAEVRHAAYETLLTWKDNRDVCVILLKNLNREMQSRKGRPSVTPLLATLLASDLPETQQDVGKFLDARAAAGQDGVLTIATLADDSGEEGGPQSLASLKRMTGLKCFAGTFACRRAVVQAMVSIRLPQAVDELIGLLSGVDGEVRGDIFRFLTEISGQQRVNDAAGWRAWWKDRKEQFQFPPKAAKGSAPAPLPGTPAYYGLSIQARRMVFVIDTSGSMDGLRLLAAKRELLSAIDSLPSDAAFAIVAFNRQVASWPRNLTPATAAAKQNARSFLYGITATGDTAAYDALEAAFRFDAEAIFFLSDGEPNAGKIASPDAIISTITQTNRSRRLSIYTIGIAPGPPGGKLDTFMKTLAEENFGAYRRVEQ